MTNEHVLALFLQYVSPNYGEHMFSNFAGNAARGNLLPFATALLRATRVIDSECPGYAADMFKRIGAVHGNGLEQYESLLQILAEVYVTEGVVAAADVEDSKKLVAREPGENAGRKNIELEARIRGIWCAVEVKTPKLIAYRNQLAEREFQFQARLPNSRELGLNAALPRDNPVKDFLISAEEKFKAYEALRHRPGALRFLFIVWDDFCNELISALLSPASGLLTDRSFHQVAGHPVTYPHIDAVVIIRHQHQLLASTREETLWDGVLDPLSYWHDGFPPKTLIGTPWGRAVPPRVVQGLNLVPVSDCIGAEYIPGEITMWI